MSSFFYDQPCWYCGVAPGASRDHTHPRCLGSAKNNAIVPCCLWCNQTKSGRTIEQFREFLRLTFKKKIIMSPQYQAIHGRGFRFHGEGKPSLVTVSGSPAQPKWMIYERETA